MPHVLISGASIAGLSAAYWLRRTGWTVTVVERAETFRDGGQNVDIRGVARDVLEQMGLRQAALDRRTTESGAVLVDGNGAVQVEFPSDDVDAATAELEILRGDLAELIRDRLADDIDLVFGTTIDDVQDDPHGAGVVVSTSQGQQLTADLLVVAEGVRSATRDRLFGDLVGRRDFGVTMAFGTIPRTPSDDDRWRWYTTVGGRQIHLRPDPYGTIRAVLSYAGSDDLVSLGRDEALRRLRDRYADAGWEAGRVLDAFERSGDLYFDQLTQIRMPTWHRGRVCLLGDAAWCVTPMGGRGSSLALAGGYVLAAYLAATPQDRESALASYETWMRPLVDRVQKLPPGLIALAYPKTSLGLKVRTVVNKAMLSKPVTRLTSRLSPPPDDDRHLPPLAPANH